MRSWIPIFAFALVGLSSASQAETNCPDGTYRMITGYGGKVICVPYGQGAPAGPPPAYKPSDISGVDGDQGSPSQSTTSGVKSAQ